MNLSFDIRSSIGMLLFASLCAYGYSLNNGFSLDDYNWLERVSYREGVFQFLFEPEPGQIFSPLAKLWLLILHTLSDENPVLYHLGSLLLHLVNSVFVVLLVREISGKERVAILSGATFATMGVNHEAVYWVSAFFHPLVTCFVLSSLFCYLKFLQTSNRRFFLWFLFALSFALLSKVTGFTLIALLPLVHFVMWSTEKQIKLYWNEAILTGFVCLALASINYFLALNSSYILERDVYHAGVHLFSNLNYYLLRLFVPFELLFQTLLGKELTRQIYFVLPILLYPILAYGFWRSPAWVRFFLVFCIIGIAPFLPFTSDPTSRYFYLASVGSSAVLAYFFDLILVKTRPHRAGVAAIGFFLLLSCVESYGRDNGYQERERFMVKLAQNFEAIDRKNQLGESVLIHGFPLLAVDRCMHFEAAIRLRLRRPKMRILCPDESTQESAVNPVKQLSYANESLVLTH